MRLNMCVLTVIGSHHESACIYLIRRLIMIVFVFDL